MCWLGALKMGVKLGLRDVAWSAAKWKVMKKRLGYSDDEMKKFHENPKNKDILTKALELRKKMIIAESIDSHGCNSQHKNGDKFYFDGSGNLLTDMSPAKICI